MGVHVTAGGNVLCRFPDGKAVFDHGFALPDVPQGRLVPHGQVVFQGDLPVSVGDRFPSLQRFQSHRHQVPGRNPNHLFHEPSPSLRSQARQSR